jgi:uncharacterized protein YkuJ
MPKLKILALALAASMLAGCEKPEVVSYDRLTVEVVSVRYSSKSNTYLTLRDVNSGLSYQGERISCSSTPARKIVIGKRWYITQTTYVWPSTKKYFTRLENLNPICPRT